MKIQSKIKLAFLILSSLSLYSCVNNLNDDPEESGSIPVSISSVIKESQTRATNTAFEENDIVGLYILKQSQEISGERHAENAKFVFSAANGFKSGSEVYYPENDEGSDFIAYYPYQKSGITKNGSQMNITVAADQSKWSSHSSSDFLVATAEGIQPSRNPVALVFSHKLYKMYIQLKPCEGYTLEQLLATDPVVKITGVITKVSYDFESDKFTNLSTVADITPNGTWEIRDGMLVGKSAILIPQTMEKNSKILEISMDGRAFQCVFDDNYILEAGKAEDYTLTIEERITPNINFSIQGWGNHEEKEMKAKETDFIKNYIDVSELTFTDSYIYKIMSEGIQVAEICKEYLKSGTIIDKQAIVIYPVKEGKPNLQDGRVLQLIGESQNKHGGTVNWNIESNTLTYTAGNSAIIEKIFVDEADEIFFTEPEETKKLSPVYRIIEENRFGEENQYSIVKIATQYWMATELRTSKYANGDEIPTGNDFRETSAKFGTSIYDAYYYNAAAIAKSILLPEGWRISNMNDWETLKEYINNNAAALKKGDEWSVYPINATNLTGFSSEVIDLYNGDFRDAVVSSYWKVDNSDNAKVAKIVTLGNTNVLNETEPKDVHGLAVRCVKE